MNVIIRAFSLVFLITNLSAQVGATKEWMIEKGSKPSQEREFFIAEQKVTGVKYEPKNDVYFTAFFITNKCAVIKYSGEGELKEDTINYAFSQGGKPKYLESGKRKEDKSGKGYTMIVYITEYVCPELSKSEGRFAETHYTVTQYHVPESLKGTQTGIPESQRSWDIIVSNELGSKIIKAAAEKGL